MMEVEVPPGLRAGDLFSVQAGEQMFDVEVPDGCRGGDTICVEAPAAEAEQPTAERVEVTVPDGVADGGSFSVHAVQINFADENCASDASTAL